MQNYVNTDLQQARSLQLPNINQNNFNLNNRIFPLKQIIKNKHTSTSGTSMRYLSIDDNSSQSANMIKQRINRLRTQTPELKIDSPQNSLQKIRTKMHNKKREELTKIIMNKLKIDKVKQHARKVKKNSNNLPQLDLSGQKYQRSKIPTEQSQHKPKYKKLEVTIDHHKQYSIQKIFGTRRSPQKKHQKVYSYPIQISQTNKPNQSISGWQKIYTLEEELLPFYRN